ncbi:2-hydroxyacid dehydrogenase [Marinobacterium sediminicola]|uniref:Glycerate dehydrogenase n=1 Tax=Marinobacterium sediminicola TaxID=518898 RepID=A0ABY1RW78_9GAMM|nr:2-hydroxyacid dehydrogenase [Marinobacterium sediminicola]ULG70411.1 2-hydroxyacid dehydrogenase [Marinobacterium sediminicola]SMR69430.1 glycerate dehydrogenase [Marinobacterium sediminicola]
MKAVFLDTQSLDDLDLSPIAACLEEMACYPTTDTDQVPDRIDGFDVVITNKVVLDATTIRAAKHLKLICVVATGVNNIDLQAASDRGIVVCNSQGYGVHSVAQHVLGLILALHTRLLDYDRAVKNGSWNRSTQFCLLDFPILELNGRTLGIIGYGALGQEVARLAGCFGMNILIAARPGSVDIPADRTAINDLLANADVISLHCPLTEQTRNLIDEDAFARMKPGSFLINAARGGIVNEAALKNALCSGHLAGAATDVLSEEPPRNGNLLLDAAIPNLIITPHSAWGSVQARTTIIEQTVENIRAFQQNRPVRQVN